MSRETQYPIRDRIRVAFVIRSLHRGGAERQLADLAMGLDPHLFEVLVLTFYPGGAIWNELRAHSTVRVDSLEKRGRWDIVQCTWRLTRTLRAWRADILHTYLVEPSIYGLMAGRLAAVRAIVWGIRASNVDYSQYGRVNYLAFKTAATLSRFADLIVANSAAGRRHHLASGYTNKAFITIYNGIDTERYRPMPDARTVARHGWNVADDEFVIGISARLDPMKDHATLLRAVAILTPRCPAVRVVSCGGGSDDYVRAMRNLAHDLGIAERVRWVGEEPSMPNAYAGFDVLCSSSVGEGFSNSVAEAMACGIPCVVTDVGDSAEIVGDAGAVVPPRAPEMLADALATLCTLSPAERRALGAKARARIVGRFNLPTMVARTSAAYRALLNTPRRRTGDQIPALETDRTADSTHSRPEQGLG